MIKINYIIIHLIGRLYDILSVLICVIFLALAILGCSQSTDPMKNPHDHSVLQTQATSQTDPNLIQSFISLIQGDHSSKNEAVTKIFGQWQEWFTPMIIETVYLSRDARLNNQLIRLLRERVHFKGDGYDFNAWHQWIWDQQYAMPPMYADFKSALYRLIDLRFESYFSSNRTLKIRLDEVRWGGVKRDGIPPLRKPSMITASEATYLAESNVVFGIEVNGDVRAYPKRILAWHEMFVDTIGGTSVCGVYCTLCGSMILYNSEHNGVNYELGTSGFLYRSNKLMYDKKTLSLWSTLRGTPVIGPLANSEINLPRLTVVTTTWGEWRRRHPHTAVLSLDTGFTRDYSEGAAYREYFETDEVMFGVPEFDKRLKNKDEILALHSPQSQSPPLAISVGFLNNHAIYHDHVNSRKIVALTDRSGATRVYETRGTRFKQWDQDTELIDETGEAWELNEDHLKSTSGQTLNRLPSHRAFWFGWFATFPLTRLVH